MSVELKIPSVGESITQVTIASWLKEDGDYVEMDEALAELESDKATVELNAEQAGTLKIIVEEGEDVEIGAVVASIDTSAEPPAEKAAPAPKETTSQKEEPAPKTEVVERSTTSNYATGTPSPAANKILAEKGISAQAVTGTGKDGRITKYDAILANADTNYGESSEPSREQHREKMSNLRKTVASTD